MGLLDKLFGKKEAQKETQKETQQMEQNQNTQNPNTLMQDIPVATEWIMRALNSSGYKVDYTVESIKELDRFFDEQSGPEGIIMKHGRGNILFSIGCYVGEVAIKNYGGKWVTDDSDPSGEINIEVVLEDGSHIWPVQRVMKRCKLGAEESIYAYLYVLDKNARTL